MGLGCFLFYGWGVGEKVGLSKDIYMLLLGSLMALEIDALLSMLMMLELVLLDIWLLYLYCWVRDNDLLRGLVSGTF